MHYFIPLLILEFYPDYRLTRCRWRWQFWKGSAGTGDPPQVSVQQHPKKIWSSTPWGRLPNGGGRHLQFNTIYYYRMQMTEQRTISNMAAVG